MAISRGDDYRFSSGVLTDVNGVAQTGLTVNVAILMRNKRDVLVANGVAAHDSGGVYRRTIDRTVIAAGIPPHIKQVQVRMLIGNVADPDGTRWRLEDVKDIETDGTT